MKMDDEQLLSHLQANETDSSSFVWGQLATEREKALKEYFREPYGDEEEGLSQIVTSDVQDTVEWMLPDLLDVFTSSDKAVVFEPTQEKDVQGAAQATDAVNYVFHKQNNGFLTLYTAFKDALLTKNCAVMWRKETRRTKQVTPAQGASEEMLAMLLQEAGEDAKIEQASPLPVQMMPDPMTGEPIPGPQLYNAKVIGYKQKTTIKVEAFPPEELLVKRDWTSPLLNECPYVARMLQVTLSELHEMGFDDVKAEDLSDSTDLAISSDAAFRKNRVGDLDQSLTEASNLNEDDESRTEGLLRIEFVLVDYDGDGISERRCIYRLKDKILSNEECDQVQIATASPILIAHRWDGMSLAETVSDLQELKTELTRQMVNSGRLANNPRTEVLTTADGSPYADIDDLLDSRPGGVIRKTRADALTQNIVPWVGGQMFPMLEYVDTMREQRTGISRVQQGIDPNVLKTNRTLGEARQTAQTAKQRIKLVARIFGEILMKPTFLGILKLLTDGEMEKIAFRLRGEFVELDPNGWHDQYDMTVNVGLGTGDAEQQLAMLQAVAGAQAQAAASPLGAMLIKPKQLYNTQAQMIEAAGFKNVGDFWTDPGDAPMPSPPSPPPDPKIQIEQMKLQADAHKFQAQTQHDKEIEGIKSQAKIAEIQANLELQASNDARDFERDQVKAAHEQELAVKQLELDAYKIDADNQTKIVVAQINQNGRTGAGLMPPVEPPVDCEQPAPVATPMDQIAQSLAALEQAITAPRQLVRDPATGLTVGVEVGGVFRPIERGPDGRAIGIQ